MRFIVELDQNITYEQNVLKEKEMAFELQREKEQKEIEDIDFEINALKTEFTENLLSKKKVFLFVKKFYSLNSYVDIGRRNKSAEIIDQFTKPFDSSRKK